MVRFFVTGSIHEKCVDCSKNELSQQERGSLELKQVGPILACQHVEKLKIEVAGAVNKSKSPRTSPLNVTGSGASESHISHFLLLEQRVRSFIH
jgi:hypothetical protein